MHTICETPRYLKDAAEAGLGEEDLSAIKTAIAADPMCGDEIVGSGGARKVRFAVKGKGKSGGARVITFFSGDDVPVFLLNVFTKGQRVDLSQKDRNDMRKALAGLAADYRSGSKK